MYSKLNKACYISSQQASSVAYASADAKIHPDLGEVWELGSSVFTCIGAMAPPSRTGPSLEVFTGFPLQLIFAKVIR